MYNIYIIIIYIILPFQIPKNPAPGTGNHGCDRPLSDSPPAHVDLVKM